MRVISGSARGRKLLAPDGMLTRPTTDRVKESIFNIINPYLPAENILDLFAGSGALGIEALSRGTSHAVLVDSNRAALEIVKKNLLGARLVERADVVFKDALLFLKETQMKFDIIFLDPPYNTGLLNEAIDLIYEKSLLTDGGIILAESEVNGEEPGNNHFTIAKRAKYGKTTVFVLKID